MIHKATAYVLLAAFFVVGLGGMGISRAQPAEPPLIILTGGDLWSWSEAEGALRQLTFWGYNREPVISPDGERIAYESMAHITVDAFERVGGIGGGALPSNIWVWDIPTGQAVRVADQPPDASLFVEGVPDKGIARSLPTWSPDGGMLAWTELTYPESEDRLVVYDFVGNTANVAALSVPPQYGVPTPIEVKWGGGGIAVRSITYDAAAATPQEAIVVYDVDGNTLSDTDLQVTDTEFSLEFIWVADHGRDYVGVLYNTGRWLLIDPLTGSTQFMSGAPALYSPAAPAGAISATFTFSVDAGYEWSVIYPDGRTDPLGTFYTSQVAPSPTGQEIALLGYPERGAVFIWRNGQIARVEGTGDSPSDRYVGGVAWGPIAWRVWDNDGAGQLVSPEALTCPDFLPSRLIIGGQARVMPGSPNNLRSQPTTRSIRVGQIPSGAFFTVLHGPQCASSSAWWKVDYEGTVGWTAEGQGDTYWVEPLP